MAIGKAGLLILLLAFLLPLSGCMARYEPLTLEVADSARYAADLKFCQAAGAAYTPKASAADITESAIEGGANVVSYTPINPLIPLLGAAGGAASAASNASGYDLTGRTKTNVARHCLYDRLAADHAAIVAKPEN
jgi:hypothetical protein